MKNTMIIQEIVEDLRKELSCGKLDDIAARNIRIKIVRLNGAYVDLENYNDLKMVLDKIIN